MIAGIHDREKQNGIELRRISVRSNVVMGRLGGDCYESLKFSAFLRFRRVMVHLNIMAGC